MMFGIEPPKGTDSPWSWGARAIYLRPDAGFPPSRPAKRGAVKRAEKRPPPRVLDLLPDRQDFVVKDDIDKKLALDILNRAYRTILDVIEKRFHDEKIDPTCGEVFEGDYTADGLPCFYHYAFRPAGGYVYLGIWPVDAAPKKAAPAPREDSAFITHHLTLDKAVR